jgi:predicted amidohydrolase
MADERKLRVASVQMEHTDGDKQSNFAKLEQFVAQAVAQNVQLVVFPECCVSGYWFIRNLSTEQLAALAGADVLLAPHQTGGVGGKDPHRMGLIDPALWANRHRDPDSIEHEFRGDKGRGWLMRWLPSRAHDNGMFLIFSNGVGVDDDEIRTGNAMILDPYGRILTETWQAADAMVVADLDASLLENATGRRWIRARRPELYGPLTVPTGQERDTRELKFR